MKIEIKWHIFDAFCVEEKSVRVCKQYHGCKIYTDNSMYYIFKQGTWHCLGSVDSCKRFIDLWHAELGL